MQATSPFRRTPVRRWLPATALLATGAARAQDASLGDALVLRQFAIEGARAHAHSPVEGHVAPTRTIATPTHRASRHASLRADDDNDAQACSGRSVHAALAHPW